MGVTLCTKENIESDIVKAVDVTKNNIGEENPTKNYTALEGVSFSLRNDTIQNGKILAYTKSTNTGAVSFQFCDDEASCNKESAVYYLPNLDAEISAQTNGTSAFYIIINDPEMSGYESKYETLKQTCATPGISNNSIYLELEKAGYYYMWDNGYDRKSNASAEPAGTVSSYKNGVNNHFWEKDGAWFYQGTKTVVKK